MLLNRASETSAVVILGAGGHAKVVAEIAQSLGRKIVAVVDPNPSAGRFLDVPLFATWADYAAGGAPDAQAVIAVGDNALRARIAAEIESQSPAQKFAVLVHPSAVVAESAVLGAGTVVMAGAVVNAAAAIGRHVIINTLASVDHDNRLGDFVSVAPRAALAGNVRVGHGTAIGIGAVVANDLTIGEDTIIGAGSVVLRDVQSHVVAYGVPCRVMRLRNG